jgi:hypothetical protein
VSCAVVSLSAPAALPVLLDFLDELAKGFAAVFLGGVDHAGEFVNLFVKVFQTGVDQLALGLERGFALLRLLGETRPGELQELRAVGRKSLARK